MMKNSRQSEEAINNSCKVILLTELQAHQQHFLHNFSVTNKLSPHYDLIPIDISL